jgi:valyl-tRNA synthetase
MAEFTLAKTYDFQQVEARLYTWWEEKGYFSPMLDPDRKPFVVSMPPPNITGELHLGHAMFVAVEDMIIRYHRMQGIPTLWVPGTDHASIATQLQVEKYLLEEQGLRREDIGREAFIEKTWEWKRKYGGIITDQLRRLGASCDWTRERFTLDEGLSAAVREAFVRLYEKGLIYRANYLINWSPGLRTAVSDLEVEYSEEEGLLYYFSYPIADSEESIPVATTRPETILGDTAVAVHPDDDRYRHLIGKTCLVPILKRTIPVIHDTYVDREFGTGALKITPGHDPADYEIGQRHGLNILNVLNPDATMNEHAGPYQGLDRYECREKLWQDMQAAGLAIRTEPYTLQIPRSQRGGEIVEPIVSTQWFVRMEPLAKAGLQVVRDGQIHIVPERFNKVYFNWLENIRDWTISRQLWWGHRIPAWHCKECGEITVDRIDPTECEHCGTSEIEQDPDVLDTWFSSGLWPFSTLGWPENTEDFSYFYPTSLMETGYDILFFWVARMIMMGLEFTGSIPFHTVYLHGMIRDEQGRKMSKTLGNTIDPIQVMDQYGTDALRFTLLTGSSPGLDMNLSVQRVESNRNFANKLWNAGRLILGLIEKAPDAASNKSEMSPADRWIVALRAELSREVDRLFTSHQYGEAGRQIYEFFWGEFADWYLEIAKLQVDEDANRAWQTAQILVDTFDSSLRMLHPFTPFVTEELWGHLKRACLEHPAGFGPQDGWEEALIMARWPQAPAEEDWEDEAIRDFERVKELITAVRNVRAEKNIEVGKRIPLLVSAGDRKEVFVNSAAAIAFLARVDQEQLRIEERLENEPNSIPLVVGGVKAYIPLAGAIDTRKEKARLEGELAEIRDQIERLQKLLAGPFASRAPAEVVANEKQKLEEYHAAVAQIEDQLAELVD